MRTGGCAFGPNPACESHIGFLVRPFRRGEVPVQQTHTIGLSPWAGQPGYICCPRAENVKARPADWELIECPDCGAECYVTPTAREAARIQPELKIGRAHV